MTGESIWIEPIAMGFSSVMGQKGGGEERAPLQDGPKGSKARADMSVTAIIVAAGRGERLGGAILKQYRPLAGVPILTRAARALATHPAVGETIVVIGEGQDDRATAALSGLDARCVTGGDTRAMSVRSGLDAASGSAVLVHDAARPFCPHDVIDRLVAALEFHDGAVPVMPVSDTIARAGANLGDGIDRTSVVRVQTPQAARTEALRNAYAGWAGQSSPTDESNVLRAAGLSVAAVNGSAELDKITTAEDFERAEAWVERRTIPRSGIGFDVHAFGGQGPLMLGGVAIDHARGLLGHSDADVVLHAITDALLGAAGLGDIGDHFPPTDQRWKGAASEHFLAHAAELVRSEGAFIDAVDCTVVAEEPRIGPYREAMRHRIAGILGIEIRQVSVKATTTERLGFTGRAEGIAVQAIANIRMEIRR
jgi:2-C-methyl-D-erythritol 4-phosphate cytidylyltransferase/2-C-methyl-D-erythritol 2,4-cyclodiphosphate synthase